MKSLLDIKTVILLCLTLGLAPFFPEPHIWGKLKWIIGGAKGMQGMDWFDVIWHGFPFVLAMWVIGGKLLKRRLPKQAKYSSNKKAL